MAISLLMMYRVKFCHKMSLNYEYLLYGRMLASVFKVLKMLKS